MVYHLDLMEEHHQVRYNYFIDYLNRL